MGYATSSDRLLVFALYSGIAVLLIALILVVSIAALRAASDRKLRHESLLMERWGPIFAHAIEGLPISLPPVQRRNGEAILMAWINFSESVRGLARQRLRDLALGIGLHRMAHQLLKRRNIRSRLVGVVALGRMEAPMAVPEFVALAESPSPMLSLLAIRALVHIDPQIGVPLLLNRLGERSDWPTIRIAAMLEEVPPEIVAPALLRAFERASSDGAVKLIGLINLAHIEDAGSVLAPFLQPEQPTDMLAAALKVCRDPRCRAAVCALATHPQWIVRAQAASALGRIGVDDNLPLLQSMLSDPHWWVRYRAALALAGFPGMSMQRLATIRSTLTDPFAADIVTQVISERFAGQPS